MKGLYLKNTAVHLQRYILKREHVLPRNILLKYKPILCFTPLTFATNFLHLQDALSPR